MFLAQLCLTPHSPPPQSLPTICYNVDRYGSKAGSAKRIFLMVNATTTYLVFSRGVWHVDVNSGQPRTTEIHSDGAAGNVRISLAGVFPAT